ncbi:MAG TPA: TIGR00730 family Rossman fold protein [Saprospiraceae bacterium]|nr:TIGR00730 family Rossman fold protein [Saprospiraceae bacterium]HNT20269.1 TIGR00730 family Rossman fold protein [Saprospiraceae bacterium]
MNTISSVCVYCASSNQVDSRFFEAAERLGEALASQNITLIYGGGSTGLMGRIADRVLARGGKVIGIIPDFMEKVEWAHRGITELHIVGDMHERKKSFMDRADALVALPGGSGTLEELMEAISLKRLGLYNKPIVILNTVGFYDPLLAQLQRCIEERFMNPDSAEMWSVVAHPEEVIPAILRAPSWHTNAIERAALK